MNKKKTIYGVIILSIIVITGTFFVIDRLKYTTIQDEILNEVKIDEINSITIERYADAATIKVTDKDMIKRIFEDFSNVELKRKNRLSTLGDYSIRVYTNKSSDLGMVFHKDENVLWITKGTKGSNFYKILDNRNFLEVFENEHIKWVID
ncbi:hypothetical protein [Bacillus nitroreducens]